MYALQFNVFEHTRSSSRAYSCVVPKTCNAYYSNVGPIKECISKSATGNKMNVRSAQQGCRQRDLLSKRERTKMWRLKKDPLYGGDYILMM